MTYKYLKRERRRRELITDCTRNETKPVYKVEELKVSIYMNVREVFRDFSEKRSLKCLHF
jgi:hypothetical protein